MRCTERITDIRRFCTEETNDSRRLEQEREEREKEDRDLVIFVMTVSSGCSEQQRAVRKAQ